MRGQGSLQELLGKRRGSSVAQQQQATGEGVTVGVPAGRTGRLGGKLTTCLLPRFQARQLSAKGVISPCRHPCDPISPPPRERTQRSVEMAFNDCRRRRRCRPPLHLSPDLPGIRLPSSRPTGPVACLASAPSRHPRPLVAMSVPARPQPRQHPPAPPPPPPPFRLAKHLSTSARTPP